MVAHFSMHDQVFKHTLLFLALLFCAAKHLLEWEQFFNLSVGLRLHRRHPTWVVLDHLWRKLLQYLFFCSSKNERSDTFLEALQRCDERLGFLKFFLHFFDVGC
jgi:hypothetical protein